MRWTLPSFLLTLFAGAAVMVLSPYGSVTPGTLRNGHLPQRNDCFSCHTLMSGATEAKCKACHMPGLIGLRSVKGLALPKPNLRTRLIHEAITGDCNLCHSEHGNRLIPRDGRRFTHDLIPGGIRADCISCHSGQSPKDVIHRSASAECSQCHASNSWKPAAYDHDKMFRFDGNHPARCSDCHQPGLSFKQYTCTTCHEHALDRMERKHQKEGISQNLETCRRCHPSGNEHDTTVEGLKGGRENRESEGEYD